MVTVTMMLAMCSFSFAMSISPGPVNMVIVLSAINNGLRRTIPFVTGATIGFTLLLMFVGFGLAQLLAIYPLFLKYLTIAGSLFIIYMGYKVAVSNAGLSLPAEARKCPGFFDGFFLQWLNPKARIAAASGVTLFSSVETNLVLTTFIFIYFVICYASLTFWAVMGDKATIVLNTQSKLKFFNMTMGLLLIITACYLMWDQFSPV